MQIDKQLTRLERFLDTVEEFLDRQAEDADSEEERTKLEEYFPNLLRSSLFVTIYSVVENELNTLCRKLARKDGLDVEDLRGNGIQRANTFLTKVCRVDFPEDSREWRMLRDYNQIRNIIVHSSGRVTGTHLDSFEQNPGLDLHGNVLRLNRHFCPEVIQVAREFFAALMEAVNKKTGSSR